MAHIPKPDPVKFLVARKFPQTREIGINQPYSQKSRGSGALNTKYIDKRPKEIVDYEAKLLAMPREELLELFNKEYRQEQATKAEQEEKYRFFNQPTAAADFDHWSKTAYWQLEEAIALTLGKDPRQVNSKTMEAYFDVNSPFVEKYRNTMELATRAEGAGQLSFPCLPGDYLAWAQRYKIDLPEELIEKVRAFEADNVDWRALYDELKIANTLLAKELHELKLSGEAPSVFAQTSYGRAFLKKAEKAVEQYPAWSKSQTKIQKSGNLHDWLMKDIQADSREAEIFKKVLSELYKITN